MQQLLIVFLGGGLGSVCRYLLSRWMNQHFPQALFPLGTFSANMLGCLLIGMILAFMNKYAHTDIRISLLLATGFCGGFTTFSSFAYENQVLIDEGKLLAASLYILLSVSLGLLGTLLGIWIVKNIV
ncbi:MAG: fluoride efflux transporter CrcB [Microscillaceae bacterium]|nr:fluoride efflux transporter CrcB [Microscillaceae bacterium]